MHSVLDTLLLVSSTRSAFNKDLAPLDYCALAFTASRAGKQQDRGQNGVLGL